MKLHLGCGSKAIPGWVNVDIQSGGCDVQDDITVLNSIPDNSAEIIYSSHVLEHTSRHTWKNVLALWTRKLVPGGVLRIAVPNFEAAAEWYADNGNIQAIMGLVCGGQKDVHDHHNVIFDEKSLTQGLIEAGCTDVHRWDWRTTEHAFLDDYSQAYLPHMDKEHGKLMSLNLQARKL
jgi:predicted SAM-dependent methyltransferase